MTESNRSLLGKKILEGINLASKRLIAKRAHEDGELIYSQKGKIVKLKARDIK
jgi:hypothetical protein